MYETDSMEELVQRATWRITDKHMDGSVTIVAEVDGDYAYRFLGRYRPKTGEFHLTPNQILKPGCEWLNRVRDISIWKVNM